MSSCGFDILPQLHPDTKEFLSRFDRIFVMENYIQTGLTKQYGVESKKLVCLNVEDKYRRNDPELIDIFENQLNVEISWALKNP